MFKKFNVLITPKLEENLNNIIKLGKDKTKKMLKTNVVYKVNCKDCTAYYIGHTKRALYKRINEHKNHYNCNSVVSLHENINHKFSWNNITILDNELIYLNYL